MNGELIQGARPDGLPLECFRTAKAFGVGLIHSSGAAPALGATPLDTVGTISDTSAMRASYRPQSL